MKCSDALSIVVTVTSADNRDAAKFFSRTICCGVTFVIAATPSPEAAKVALSVVVGEITESVNSVTVAELVPVGGRTIPT